jgi:hypothetical protein
MPPFYIADFERVTDEAFSFLTRRYGYAPCPVERGGLWGTGYLRRYVRDQQEVSVCFGDADSHYLCTVSFRDDAGQANAPQYTTRDLATLLVKRYPAFVHPTRSNLSGDTTPESIVRNYGKLVGEYAVDVIEGDFSAFAHQ